MAKRPATAKKPEAPAGDETLVDIETTAVDNGKKDDVLLEAGAGDDIAKMREKLANAERERDEARAQATANAAHAEAERARAGKFQSAAEQAAYGELLGGLENAKKTADQIEKDLAAAYKAGDYPKVASLQRQQARVESQLMGYEGLKADFDKQVEARKHQVKDDSLEGRMEAANLSQPTRAWFRAHPDYFTDPSKNALATAAHYKAKARRLKEDTKEYFEFCEEELGLDASGAGTDGETVEREDPPEESRGRVASAPVSRQSPSGGGNGGGGNRKIRLTSEQLDTARALGMTPVEYAQDLEAEVRAGRLTRDKINYA